MKMALLYERLSAPARRALESLNLRNVESLAGLGRTEVAGLHGIGPNALASIEAALGELGLSFKSAPKTGAARATATDGALLVDRYIRTFPPAAQDRLNQLRALIKKAAPKAVEKMTYGIPTYFWKGNLVHFAGYDTHIGFYPTPSGIAAFKDELSKYKSAKGSVQFPLSRPLPLSLIKRIVAYRIPEVSSK